MKCTENVGPQYETDESEHGNYGHHGAEIVDRGHASVGQLERLLEHGKDGCVDNWVHLILFLHKKERDGVRNLSASFFAEQQFRVISARFLSCTE